MMKSREDCGGAVRTAEKLKTFFEEEKVRAYSREKNSLRPVFFAQRFVCLIES